MEIVQLIAIGIAVLLVVLYMFGMFDGLFGSSGSSYTFYQGKNSGRAAGSERNLPRQMSLIDDVPGLQAWCDAEVDCKGFTTSGYMKRSLLPPEKWKTWTSDPNKGMYVKV